MRPGAGQGRPAAVKKPRAGSGENKTRSASAPRTNPGTQTRKRKAAAAPRQSQGSAPQGKKRTGRPASNPGRTKPVSPERNGRVVRRSAQGIEVKDTRAMLEEERRIREEKRKNSLWTLVKKMCRQMCTRSTGSIDKPFLGTLFLLVGIGMVMVFSASMYSSLNSGGNAYDALLRQGVFAGIGFVVMYLFSRVDYEDYCNEKFQYVFLGFSALLLAATLVIGVDVNGAKRWISIPGGTFQPSELAKVAIIMYSATTAVKYKDSLTKTGPFWLRQMLPLGLLFGLTAIEPSLSAALAIAVAGFAVMWFGMVSGKNLLQLIAVGCAGVGLLILKEPWRLTRIRVFGGQVELSYQIKQSLVAFGSGGLFGVGLGQGKQKLLFLPELQNDFIFANIGEEFGLVGCVAVILIYCYFIFRGYQIAFAIRKKSQFGFLYTCGVMTLLGFQMCVNIGVATKSIPVTGMALPFISYGGTSMVVLFFMLAPIMNMSRQIKVPSFFQSFRPRTVKEKRVRVKKTVRKQASAAPQVPPSAR